MLVKFTGKDGEQPVGIRDEKEYFLSLEPCSGCGKKALILTPTGGDGECLRRCGCTAGYQSAASLATAAQQNDRMATAGTNQPAGSMK